MSINERTIGSEPEVTVVRDQIYSRAGGVGRLADVYLPGTSKAPVVLWLHGGGWRFGDRRLAPDLAAFVRQSRLAVVSIDYRLSDEAKFPAPVEDVKTAVRWVRCIAGKFDFDGKRIGLWGSSAGGHLAACAALSGEEDFRTDEYPQHSSAVQAVVDGYGPMNFAKIDADRGAAAPPGTDAESLGIGNLLPAGDPESFESRLLGVPVSSSPGEVALADPVHYVREACPPFLILHGESDAIIPSTQSTDLFNALNAVGNETTLILFENLKHGFLNDKHLTKDNYGSVKIHRSWSSISKGKWSCDASADIPSMVGSFLRASLLSTR